MGSYSHGVNLEIDVDEMKTENLKHNFERVGREI